MPLAPPPSRTAPLRSGLALLLCLGIAALAPVSPAVAEEGPRRRVIQEGAVLRNGDIEMVHTIRLPLRDYTALKHQSRNSELLLRKLGIYGQAAVFRHARVAFDDGARSLTLHVVMVGAMKNRGARWFTPITNGENQEVLALDDRSITLLSVNRLDGGGLETVTTKLTFPEGTRGLRFDAKRGRVVCEMPPPTANPKGHPDVRTDVALHPEIMSCFYRLYGKPAFSQLWIARITFVNQGDAPARDLRVRFRIAGYTAWSPWQKSPLLHPGQTSVEPYYPLFDRKVSELTSETPSTLQWEWAYRLPDGSHVEESDTQPITLLGMNEVIYSSLPYAETTSWFERFDNVPLIGATFVSHTDPIIQRFAGMAAQVAQGAGASIDNTHALHYMRAVYDLMVSNRIAYQSPPGMFKQGVRQHVKYGRDVLRNRAGTCIDLAVLYASTCIAGGLDAYLVLIPGHAFPAVRLPGGALVPLEATALSMSPGAPARSFLQALQLGEQNMDAAVASGQFYLCDIDAMRVAGVPPPQLPTLPPGTLEQWGIRAHAGGASDERPPSTEKAPPHPKRPDAALPAMTLYRDAAGLFEFPAPRSWKAESDGAGVSVTAPDGTATVNLNVTRREGLEQDAFVQKGLTAVRSSFPGWRGLDRKSLALSGFPAAYVRGTASYEDQPVRLHCFLVTSKELHWMLLYVTMAEDPAEHERIFTHMVGGCQLRDPNEVPPPELRQLGRKPDPFLFGVPANWRVQYEGADVVARSVQGDALALCRVGPKSFETVEAAAEDVIARMGKRATSLKLRKQQTIEVSGRPLYMANLETENGGVTWRRALQVTFSGDQQVVLILAARADTSFKWRSVLTAIAESFDVK